MLSSQDEFLSVYLSEEELRIAHVKIVAGATKVLQVVAKDMKGVAEDDWAKTVRSSLTGFNIKSSQVICVVPPSQITTKNIEIPSTNPEEIKSIVNLQAGRHTPFSREEILVGYINIGVYKNNYTKVLLVITNKNVVKNQLGILGQAGLEVRKVLFAPEGLASFYGKALDLAQSATPIGVIEVGKETTNFIIVLRGSAIMVRSIPIGKAKLKSEGKEAYVKLTEELGKTLESYQSEDIDEVPGSHVLTMDDNYTKDLQPLLKEKLGWDVKIVSYIDSLSVNQPVLVGLASEYEDTSFLDVICCAIHAKAPQVNFMPEEMQLQKSIEDQGKEIFKTAVGILAVMMLLAITLSLKMYFHNSYLSKVKNSFKKNRNEVMSLENRSVKMRIIQDHMKSRMISLDTINELYNNIPDEVYLTSLDMDEEGNVSIQGISDIASLVFNLGSALKESPLFESVNIKSTVAKKDRGKDVSAFEITLKLKGVNKEGKSKEVLPEEKPAAKEVKK